MSSEGWIVRFARILRRYEQAPFGVAVLLGAIISEAVSAFLH